MSNTNTKPLSREELEELKAAQEEIRRLGGPFAAHPTIDSLLATIDALQPFKAAYDSGNRSFHRCYDGEVMSYPAMLCSRCMPSAECQDFDPVKEIDALQAQVDGLKLLTDIPAFVERIERRAEGNMLKTGKLEGAHYAAMKAELKALAQPEQKEE